MCGEHEGDGDTIGADEGSSPHVRGAHIALDDVAHLVGIIPACAGSTTPVGVSAVCFRDHPRMCGEHIVNSSIGWTPAGSSPHVRGAQCCFYSHS